MPEVRTTKGTVTYSDTGEGQVIVFVHGVLVDGDLWRKVVEPLGADFRCVRPNLPLGAHRIPLDPAADLSPRGVADLIREFIEALDLHDVTIVANDTGGAITQLLLADGCDRIGRVVLTPCDSFDNFLPLSIRALQYLPRIPGALAATAWPMRFAVARRIALRWLTVRPVPDGVTAQWMKPLIDNPGIRRDLAKFLRGIDKKDTLAAAQTLRDFTKPVLLLWPRKLPYFPFAHAEKWTTILQQSTLVEVPDSYTFVSEDQPEFVAREIASFVRSAARRDRSHPSVPDRGTDPATT